MFRLLENPRRSAVLASTAGALAVFVAGAAGAGARDPSFAPGAPIAGGLGAVADFNGDGKPDLAVVRSSGIAILLGDGAGGFTAAAGSPVKTDKSPEVLARDFNGDRIPDLAVSSKSQELTVLLGDGSGRFATAPGSPMKTAGDLRAVADFDGDGKLDLVGSAGSGKLTILLGDGSGRFVTAPGSPFASGSKAASVVAVADFDGDGKPDLAVGGGYEPKYLLILPGKGDGRFGAATKIPLPANETSSLAVGDFNRDGNADLVVGSAYDYSLSILLGNGRGGLRRASHYPEVFDYGAPSGIAVGDLDGNGVPDLAVAGDGVALLLGNGKGGFRPAAEPPLPIGAGQIVAADFDGNRKVDLVVSGAQGVTILFQTRSAPTVGRSRTLSGRPDAVLSMRASVGLLAADGNRVAAASCEGIVVWKAPVRKPPTSFKTSGDCVEELALDDGQVAWVSGGSGNTQEWQDLRAASISGGKVKRVEHVVRDRDNAGNTPGGAYVGQLLGAGSLLAYNRWICSRTNPESGDCDPTGLARKQLVRIVAGRRVDVRRGRDSYRLSAVGGGRMAVVSDGAVTVLGANGSRGARVVALEREPTRAVALSGTRLAVERTFTLDLFNPATGKRTESLPLGPAAALELAGLNAKLALLKGHRELVLVRLSDGKLISLPLYGVIGPTLTEAGLFYAYNTPKSAMKGHVVFEPTAKLLARF